MFGFRGRFAPLILVLMGLVAGCSGGGGSGGSQAPPFDAAQTLRQASAAMANVKSVGFTLASEEKPPIPVRAGEIQLLRNGDADGTVTLEQAGQSVEMQLVSVGESVYIKGVTGGWRQVPKALAASMYDPSAVLDPDRGIAKLLTSLTGAKAEAKEKVNGKDAYRMGVTLPRAAIGGLVPGIESDVRGQVWVGAADHRLLKVRGEVPPLAQGGEKGAVIITFTEFDEPYEIKAPA
jgi:lipoprotein LprG